MVENKLPFEELGQLGVEAWKYPMSLQVPPLLLKAAKEEKLKNWVSGGMWSCFLGDGEQALKSRFNRLPPLQGHKTSRQAKRKLSNGIQS